jgi:DNA-binding transcriptional LysR family regulator
MGSVGVYRWEFDNGSKSLAVGVNGPLIIDDMHMTVRAALNGVGLAVSLEEYVAPHLASGELERVLEEWCPPFAGFFPYYPSRKQQPAALAALSDMLRLTVVGDRP